MFLQNSCTVVLISGVLEDSLSYERRSEIIEWIYSCQATTGFLGSTFLKSKQSSEISSKSVHVAMTYTALATLVILGDDLSRVNKAGLLQVWQNNRYLSHLSHMITTFSRERNSKKVKIFSYE